MSSVLSGGRKRRRQGFVPHPSSRLDSRSSNTKSVSIPVDSRDRCVSLSGSRLLVREAREPNGRRLTRDSPLPSLVDQRPTGSSCATARRSRRGSSVSARVTLGRAQRDATPQSRSSVSPLRRPRRADRFSWATSDRPRERAGASSKCRAAARSASSRIRRSETHWGWSSAGQRSGSSPGCSFPRHASRIDRWARCPTESSTLRRRLQARRSKAASRSRRMPLAAPASMAGSWPQAFTSGRSNPRLALAEPHRGRIRPKRNTSVCFIGEGRLPGLPGNQLARPAP